MEYYGYRRTAVIRLIPIVKIDDNAVPSPNNFNIIIIIIILCRQIRVQSLV